MNSVLLLNVDCTPLRVIPASRAVCLLLAGHAEPMADDVVARFRSAHDFVDVPAVVRLGYAVKLPFQKMKVPCSKRGILVRDNFECQFIVNGRPCEERGDTIDHVHPKAKGGDTMSWGNLVAACSKHNHRKGARTLDELGWSLKREPVAPRSQVRVIGNRGAEYPASWLPFLPQAQLA